MEDYEYEQTMDSDRCEVEYETPPKSEDSTQALYEGERKCIRCRIDHPLSDFSKNKLETISGTPIILDNLTCDSCRSYMKNYYKLVKNQIVTAEQAFNLRLEYTNRMHGVKSALRRIKPRHEKMIDKMAKGRSVDDGRFKRLDDRLRSKTKIYNEYYCMWHKLDERYNDLLLIEKTHPPTKICSRCLKSCDKTLFKFKKDGSQSKTCKQCLLLLPKKYKESDDLPKIIYVNPYAEKKEDEEEDYEEDKDYITYKKIQLITDNLDNITIYEDYIMYNDKKIMPSKRERIVGWCILFFNKGKELRIKQQETPDEVDKQKIEAEIQDIKKYYKLMLMIDAKCKTFPTITTRICKRCKKTLQDIDFKNATSSNCIKCQEYKKINELNRKHKLLSTST